MNEEFKPKFWMRNHHLQSFLASARLRALGKNAMLECSQEMKIDGGNGVRLLGFYSPQPQVTGKGLVILIHGWEGSSESTYVLVTGNLLFQKGYEVFRLNLRDHGKSHHLNEGLFHGALIDETVTAIQHIAALAKGKPSWIIGFSLGGNFALRTGFHVKANMIKNLKHIITISPPLGPRKATLLIDQSFFFYRYYFLKKWQKSLKIKQHFFPDLYHFEDIFKMKTCMEITDAVIPRYSSFRNSTEYFESYTIREADLKNLAVPATTIVAADDPVIPVEDFANIHQHEYYRLCISKYGGHCGFIDTFPYFCWYEKKILEILEHTT